MLTLESHLLFKSCLCCNRKLFSVIAYELQQILFLSLIFCQRRIIRLNQRNSTFGTVVDGLHEPDLGFHPQICWVCWPQSWWLCQECLGLFFAVQGEEIEESQRSARNICFQWSADIERLLVQSLRGCVVRRTGKILYHRRFGFVADAIIETSEGNEVLREKPQMATSGLISGAG